MKKTSLMSVMAAPLLAFALTLPTHAADATAPTTCTDGTTSNATGKGACSGHGGVQKATSIDDECRSGSRHSSGSAGRTGGERWSNHLQGRYDLQRHRQGCMQRSWRRAESDQVHAGGCACCGCSGPAATPAPATTAAKSTPSATKSAPTATAGNTDPTGATAKCKDGTYSKSQHRSGTCSSHGGVAEWLNAAQ